MHSLVAVLLGNAVLSKGNSGIVRCGKRDPSGYQGRRSGTLLNLHIKTPAGFGAIDISPKLTDRQFGRRWRQPARWYHGVTLPFW